MKRFITFMILILTVSHVLAAPQVNSDDTNFQGEFFFDGISENCKLPCWNNLLINSSSEDELVELLKGMKLNNSGYSPFFDETLHGYGQGITVRQDDEHSYKFGISGYSDSDNILQALKFEWIHATDSLLFIPNIFELYGTPTQITVSLINGFDELFPVLFALQYDDLKTLFHYWFWTTSAYPSELCTSNENWENWGGDLSITIMNTELLNWEALLDFEQQGFPIDNENVFTLEALVGVSPQEFTEGVLESENSNYCVEFDDPR